MLEQLKLVRGAVADKAIVPLMTHFYFHDNRVQGTDNRVTIEAPLECKELDGYAVPADRFFKAVEACGGNPELAVKNEYLTVSKGRFRVRMPIQGGVDFPAIPAPTELGSEAIYLAAMKKVRQYVASDATRPFACGVLFHDGKLYATNNVAIVRTDVGYHGPDLLLPSYCIDELLRLPFSVYSVQAHETGLYLQPAGSKVWVHTRASELKWPDPESFFTDMDDIPEFPDGVLKLVQKLKKFVPDTKNPIIIFDGDKVRTAEGEFCAEAELCELPRSAWRAEVLEMVLGDATHFDAGRHPDPCPFYGNGVEGKVVGVRL